MEIVNKTKDIYSWLTKTPHHSTIQTLSDNAILNIANDVNSIFSDINLGENKSEINLPRLAISGGQSSGKSSVWNSIITMDILPTDEDISTRTALEIRLHKTSMGSSGRAEFKHYDFSGNNSNSCILDKKINITVPTPTVDEVNKIRAYISHRTIELAGPEMDVSSTPIILDIYSPYVPNLSLIDLPGLTQTACTDKGQPKDIKQKIEDLVAHYIKQERTIILSVVQARVDVQADYGFAFAKQFDEFGKRTICVLTKPDLMNSEKHVGDYLINNSNISKNLALSNGYFVVKNRSSKEADKYNILEGFELERNYFNGHSEYKKSLYADRVGMNNLTSSLNKLLVSSINELIPSVMGEITLLEEKIRTKLDDLGESLPDSKEGKIAVLNKYVSNFTNKFLDSVESRGTVLNTGKKIKDIFVDYKSNLKLVKPFADNNNYNKSYFDEILSSFEGNHMSFHIPPVQIIEVCMTDPNLRPILRMREATMFCIDRICSSLIDLIKDILEQDQFSKYPELVSHLTSNIVENLISSVKIDTQKRCMELLLEEESYIWTDDEKFLDTLTKCTKTQFDEICIKMLLSSYYTSIKEVVSHTIPKIIMTHIVRYIEKNLLSHLMHTTVNEDKIVMLKEDSDVEKQRTYYIGLRKRIDTVKKTFRQNV